MFRAIPNIMPAALAKIPGKDTIDELLCWGHESDAAPEGGLVVRDSEQGMPRVSEILDEQVWSNGATFPIHLHRINSKCHVLADSINYALGCLALEYSDCIVSSRYDNL